MKNAGALTITSGVLFALATAGQVVGPSYYPANRPPDDKLTVQGKEVPVREYTKEEARGRDLYVREGCASCHTQSVRAHTADELRWGPPAQPAEYSRDSHPLLGTRRIGPDLSRVGGRVEDGWHLAHLFDPRLVVPDSVMPAYPWLFRSVRIKADVMGDKIQFGVIPDAADALFEKKGDEKSVVEADEFGRAFLKTADGRPALKVVGTPELKLLGDPKGFTAKEVTVIAPTEDALALVAYLQRLGTDLGDWQEEHREVHGGSGATATATSLALGQVTYERRCAGCHGVRGDGRGAVRTFLRTPPRDFTALDPESGGPIRPTFKYGSVKAGQLPTDADLHRTVTRGLRDTGMPSFASMPERDRWAVIQYVKSFTPWFAEWKLRTGKDWKGEPQPPAEPVSADPFIEEGEAGVKQAVALGAEVYHGLATCWTCHRAYATEDQVKDFLAKFTKPPSWRPDADKKSEPKEDKFGQMTMPTDFLQDPLKSGASLENLYRVIGMGIAGTAMPTWKGQLEEEQLWAMAYYVRSLRDREEKK